MLIIPVSRDCQFDTAFVEFCRPIFRRITRLKLNADSAELQPQLNRDCNRRMRLQSHASLLNW